MEILSKYNISEMFILNSSGMLVYHYGRNDENHSKLAILASSFNSLYDMSEKISNKNLQITSLFISTENSVISFYRTITSFTFIFKASGRVTEYLFFKVYLIFAKKTFRDPFYRTEMLCYKKINDK